MPVFTVHGPKAAAGTIGSSDRIAFVRDGFHVWAFVFGLGWLLWHRLWLASLGYIVLSVGLMLGMGALGLSSDARFVVIFLVALLMGFEASSLRRWTLSRRKCHLLDLVVADDRDSAEHRFFDRWVSSQRRAPYGGHDRGAPPPVRDFPSQPLPRNEVLGLFPQPGPMR